MIFETFRFPDVKDELVVDQRVSFDLPSDDEGLTGIVQNKKASDLEERVARALRVNNLRFDFRVFVPTLYSFPGQDKEVDFLVHLGIALQPLGVKGFIGHHTQAQASDDATRELFLNQAFQLMPGWLPFKDLKWTELLNQEDANRAIRNMF